MACFHRLVVVCVVILSALSAPAQAPADRKLPPDAQFGNWLYRTPDPAVWTKAEKDGALVFSTAQPTGDFCSLTLFRDAPAFANFPDQFNAAIAADQKAKGTVKIEADSAAKPSKSTDGFDVLTRSIRAETAELHTLHLYVAGHSKDQFNLAAFQTSGEESWNRYGAQASQFMLSLKLANSLPPDEVARLVGPPKAPPPTLPGFGDVFGAEAQPANPAPKPAVLVQNDLPRPAPAALAPTKIPDRPLNASPLVAKNAVIQKNGAPVDGIKLSQHDREILSPSIAVTSQGVIHVAFVEMHRTTYAYAAYHRSSADGGKTWTETKNLSEDMAKIKVGRCVVLADGRDRVYVIWRAGLAENFNASPDPGGATQSNLMYRVLENGKWSRIKPVHPPGSKEKQNDGSISYFAAVDAAGRVQVIWNTLPDKWHPELMKTSGAYQQHLSGVGNGLVFQATLDGTEASAPREVFLTPVAGQDEQGGYGTHCDGLDAINGYFDAEGVPHFVAAVTRTHDDSLRGKSRYQLIENGSMGSYVDLPELSYHGWRDIPTLLVDASGRRHLVLLYPAGEHPSIRDYLIGHDDEEPEIIRQAATVTGTTDGFQAFQGPGGRMVAVMQMNDTGEKGSGDTFVSISQGKGWSTPVNVTNNEGRKSFASRQTSRASNIAVATSYYPGPAAVAYDRDGHLLLLMINNEFGLFGSSAFGVSLGGGSSSTPVLQFLKL